MKKKRLIHKDEFHAPIILLDILKNGWLVILAVISVCIGVFSYSTFYQKPLYTTEAIFVISPRSNGSYVGFYSSLSTATEMAGVFEEVFASDVLKRLIQEDLQDPRLPFQVTASVERDTNILFVRAQSDTPEHAHAVIQSVLRNYGRISGYLFGSVVLDLLKKPQIAVTPSNFIDTPNAMIVGAILAAIITMALIALFSVLRPTAKTLAGAKRKMEESPLAVLQKEKPLQRLRKREKRPLLITDAGTSFRYTESLLQLAHRVHHKMKKGNMKVLLVTSVAENEGKSTVSANLALALAKQGYKVAYVDMDLRKPAVHKIFSHLPKEDLITCLQKGVPDSLDTPKRLHILCQNKPVPESDKLLHSDELVALMGALREKMDLVILDSSPYTATADTGMLLPHVDACIMIMRQDWVPTHICRDVVDDLEESKTHYLGYVLNHYLDNGTINIFKNRYDKYGYYKKTRLE